MHANHPGILPHAHLAWHGRGWKWDSYAAPCVWQLLPKAYGWPLSYGNSTSHRGKEWAQDHGNPILLTSIILCLRWTPKLGLIFCGSSLCQCEPSPFSQYARHLHNSKQHHSPLQQICNGERERHRIQELIMLRWQLLELFDNHCSIQKWNEIYNMLSVTWRMG